MIRNCKRCKDNEAEKGSLNCKKCNERNERHNAKLLAETPHTVSKSSATYDELEREFDRPGFDYSVYQFD
jgi:hypothetical protein